MNDDLLNDNVVSYFNKNTKPIDIYYKYSSKIKYNLKILCNITFGNKDGIITSENEKYTNYIIQSIDKLSIEYINYLGNCYFYKITNNNELDNIILMIWTINITCYWIFMKYCIDICDKIYLPFYKNRDICEINMETINKLEIKLLKFIDFRIYNYIKPIFI